MFTLLLIISLFVFIIIPTLFMLGVKVEEDALSRDKLPWVIVIFSFIFVWLFLGMHIAEKLREIELKKRRRD